MKRFDSIDGEQGMTLVELLVATAAGIVVVFGISLAVIVTTRQTARVVNHVEANQRARLTMSKVIDQLHSACIAYNITPIQKESTATSMTFVHQIGSAVSPVPVKSTISLSGTTLSQSDYASTGGAAPEWTYSSTPSSTVELLSGVSQFSASVPLFRYYSYAEGKLSQLAVPLTKESAINAVQVSVAFKAAPVHTSPNDPGAASSVQDAALLRLSPASFETSAVNLPCQ